MTLTEFLILLLIAALCGGIGQSLVGYSMGGCLTSIIVGLIGAYIGTWIARELNLPSILPLKVAGVSFPVVWSILGSAVFAAVLGLLNRAAVGRRRRF